MEARHKQGDFFLDSFATYVLTSYFSRSYWEIQLAWQWSEARQPQLEASFLASHLVGGQERQCYQLQLCLRGHELTVQHFGILDRRMRFPPP